MYFRTLDRGQEWEKKFQEKIEAERQQLEASRNFKARPMPVHESPDFVSNSLVKVRHVDFIIETVETSCCD
jgi:hypothetical protein